MKCEDCAAWGPNKAMMPGRFYCQVTQYSQGPDERCRMEWQIEKRDYLNAKKEREKPHENHGAL